MVEVAILLIVPLNYMLIRHHCPRTLDLTTRELRYATRPLLGQELKNGTILIGTTFIIP